jgi:catechol 2,3-dioxygenase-like lactoylglutathione lyase family enzyme
MYWLLILTLIIGGMYMMREPLMYMVASRVTTIDHASFAVNNYEKSADFYDQTFALLGVKRVMTIDMEHVKTIGYGKGKPSFWISDRGRVEGEEVGKARGMHIAFVAPSVEAVNAWYKKALELGAIDNGVPGPRPEYHPGYYGAFVIDPNGWRIEACLHHYRG